MPVITRLCGGIGNQMFQYATGLAVARHIKTEHVLDVSKYDYEKELRSYSLSLFRGVQERLTRGVTGRILFEGGLRFDPQLFATATDDCSLVGYWQTEKYFSELKNELKEIFSHKLNIPDDTQETLTRIHDAGHRSTFLTVRRTDYVGSSYHRLLPHEYYLAALEKISEHVTDPIIFVFSDEPEWCRQNFKIPYETVYAGNYHQTTPQQLGREDAELHLMRRCSNAVIANSSYSWWGAWLGNADSHGTVVAPEQWFGPDCKEDSRDIIPARWIKL